MGKTTNILNWCFFAGFLNQSSTVWPSESSHTSLRDVVQIFRYPALVAPSFFLAPKIPALEVFGSNTRIEAILSGKTSQWGNVSTSLFCQDLMWKLVNCGLGGGSQVCEGRRLLVGYP